MQSSLHPYSASSPHDVAARSKQFTTRQIIIGALLGQFPLLVMLTFLFIPGGTSYAVYGFEYTSPVVLLIAVACLFLKGRRQISALALPVWVLSVAYAFMLVLIL